jgi:prepilin-type N-terminal cleavage/methylation domain-containing protein
MNGHNPQTRRRPGSCRGFTLLELLVYIGVLLVISGIAMSSLNRLWSAAGNASASTDDHGAALRAAEQWRLDVRTASAAVTIEDQGHRCRIPNASGDITWNLTNGVLSRQITDRPANLKLPRVREARFATDKRKEVTALRCDLVLIPRSTKARTAPAFSFLAVPAHRPNLATP